MKARDCLNVADAYLKWLDEDGSLLDVEWLLGDKLHLLTRSLQDSFVSDVSGRPYENVSRERAILAFTVFLSMRHGILKTEHPFTPSKRR